MYPWGYTYPSLGAPGLEQSKQLIYCLPLIIIIIIIIIIIYLLALFNDYSFLAP